RLSHPIACTADAAGNVYVLENNYRTVRKVSPSGDVSTHVRLSRFVGAIAADPDGPLHVVGDATGQRVSPAGGKSPGAGAANAPGVVDGAGAAARLSYSTAIARVPGGDLFVLDAGTVRRVTDAGVVTTVAGLAPLPQAVVDGPLATARVYALALAVDDDGTL